MGERPRVRLGDHVDMAFGFAFKSAGYRTSPPGVRLARGDNVKEGNFEWGSGKVRYWGAVTDELRPYLLQKDDVLIGMDGSKVGRNWVRVREADLPCLLVQRVARLRAKESLDQIFLAALISSDAFKNHVFAVKTGSSIPHISGKQIGEFEFSLPPLPQQRSIAAVLGSLDDKIEVNRRTARVLEGLARTIFRSWFVDFDPVRARQANPGATNPTGLPDDLAALFPARLVDSPLGDIPEGWEVGTLGDFFELGLGGAWGEDAADARADTSIRCLRGIDCHALAEGTMPDIPVRWVSAKQAADRVLRNGSILFEGSGSFCGRSLYWDEDFATLVSGPIGYSNFCKRIDPRSGTTSIDPAQALICWMMVRRAYGTGELQAFRTGTAFPNFDIHGALANLPVVVPTAAPARCFADFFRTTRRLDLIAQSATLAALRDALLPKLISGELPVPAAEAVVAEVG